MTAEITVRNNRGKWPPEKGRVPPTNLVTKCHLA
jgi:hypothetical protein